MKIGKKKNIKKLIKVTGTLMTIAGLYLAFSKVKNKTEITERILTKINDLDV